MTPDAALLCARVVLGGLFVASGWHKLFVPSRRAAMLATMQRDKIPFPRFNAIWVPFWELVAGAAVLIGFATVWAAAILGAICLVALCTDGIPSIKARWAPIDVADWLSCVCYLPETALGALTMVLIGFGPGTLTIGGPI